MTIDEVWLFLADILQKPKYGWLTPTQRNSYAKMAQWQEYELLITMAEKNQYIMQQMQPFIKQNVLTFDSQFADLPTDWYMYANQYTKTFTNAKDCDSESITAIQSIRMVDLNELSDRLASNIPGRRPDISHPIGLLQDSVIQVWPNETKSGTVFYWRKPSDPIWNYTLDGQGRPVFASTGGVIGNGNSVNWEFPDGKHYKLCARILLAMGISLRETALAQYADELEAKSPV